MSHFDDAHRELEQAKFVLDLAQDNFERAQEKLMRVVLNPPEENERRVGFGPA